MALLQGKRIVIVGGTSGIGLSAARAFIREGAKIVAFGLDADEARRSGCAIRTAHFFEADATTPDAVDRAIRQCARRFGGLDGLYHVAGGSGRRFGDGPIHELTDEGWEKTLRLNLTSVAWSNRAAVRQFLRQQSAGAILNLSSVLAFSPATAHFSTHAYAAAKAGIIGLSRSLAACYARRDVRVNVLAPGLVETPMAMRAVGDPRIRDYVRRKQPLAGGRIGQPQDLDAIAVYLMSDAARFVTGQVIAVDGGWTLSDAGE